MIFTKNKTGNHYIKQNKLDQKKDKYIIYIDICIWKREYIYICCIYRYVQHETKSSIMRREGRWWLSGGEESQKSKGE